MKELYSDENDWFRVLFDENAQRHLIEVDCGGVAVYTVCVQMTDDEVALFDRDKSEMKRLAAQIRKDQVQFASRTVRCGDAS